MNKKLEAAAAKNKPRNMFAVIDIKDLPDGIPVMGVQEFSGKALAEFHLIERVLWPIALGDPRQYSPPTKTKRRIK